MPQELVGDAVKPLLHEFFETLVADFDHENPT